MKTAEKYCINSSYTGTSCAAGDEVVIRFEYNNDNLLMTGMTVTEPLGGAVRRTCYQYDKLGNRIGAREPKAAVTSCN
jgi:YD repeat-containing protein